MSDPITPDDATALLDVVARVACGGDPGTALAILHRQDGAGVDILLGDVLDVDTLAQVPLPTDAGPPVLALVPFRQVRERGFECQDDGTPLRCLVARRHAVVPLEALLEVLPLDVPALADLAFDVDDDAYADVVRRVVADEIGRGEGANFVIRRDLVGRLGQGGHHRAALAVLRRLLLGEPGAYWAFAVLAGEVTMVGATPERHVSVRDGEVVMNPISGTYRYPSGGPTAPGVLRFLADVKETEELSMVVDEELKMMSAVCPGGGRVLGPFLKAMSRLAHTEYELVGRTTHDVRDVLRATMFAATVTGSPVENACRVVAAHEGRGRGYYGGMLALLSPQAGGGTSLDAPILLRTAYLGPDGGVRIPVGATLVRHSVPASEVAETHAKAAGLLAAFGVGRPAAPPSLPRAVVAAASCPADLPGVAAALRARNDTLAPFWLRDQADTASPGLVGRTAVVIDAQDAWTAMLAHVLRHLGMTATVARWDELAAAGPGGALDAADLVVAGPGPGDPRDRSDPRIVWLHLLLAARLASGRPTLAVCLSHQVLAGLLGLRLGPDAGGPAGQPRRGPAPRRRPGPPRLGGPANRGGAGPGGSGDRLGAVPPGVGALGGRRAAARRARVAAAGPC